jgi:3-(3-hydroxy-phenyl)propionate hydroxylase
MAGTALQRGDARTTALRERFGELATLEEPRKRIAAERHGLDIRYDLGAGHPLLGRRMPDLDLVTAEGPLRTYALLNQARPALINFGDPGGIDISPWADRVQLVDAASAGPWKLPVLGEVPAPAAVLIRPDGHVAWVGEGTDDGLVDSLHLVRPGRCRGPPMSSRVGGSPCCRAAATCASGK